jgi:hypothetical protein
LRLADQIQVETGLDPGGFRAAVAERISRAQHFEVGRDVGVACWNVNNSRPSSIKSAFHLVKLPYPICWVEWCGDFIPFDRFGGDPAELEVPHRMGFLAEQLEGGGISLTWAWSFKEPKIAGLHINVCPCGVVIAQDEAWREEYLRLRDDDSLAERIRDTDITKPAWRGLPDSELEALLELEARIVAVQSPYAVGFMKEIMQKVPKFLCRKMLESSYDDILGEPMFAISFLLMLNSPNAMEFEKEDLSKLNRIRGRSGKRDLHEFVVTKLRLPRGLSRRALGSGLSHSEIRAHLVRGHFKVRKTGVFWWSPYLWGRERAGFVDRSRYALENADASSKFH